MTGLPPGTTFLAIALAAVATYSLRAGGLLLAQWLPERGAARRAMEALPGSILISLVAPNILDAGPWGVGGALLTALITWRSRNVFLAMLAGMAVVILGRRLGF